MNRFRKHLPAAMAVALVLSLGACGGSDEDDVRSASEDFVSAFKDENWEEVCTRMTKKSKAALEQAAEALDVKGCEAVWTKAAPSIPPEAKKQLENFKIESVKVNGDGDKATVTSNADDGSATQLVKEDGEWRVNFDL